MRIKGIIIEMKKKKFIENFFIYIGVTSAFFTIIGLICASDISSFFDKNENYKIYFIIIVGALNLCFAGFSIRRKNKLSLDITKKVHANVYYNDLFQSKGIIVIPVNDYFDTIVDDKIISSNTIHGKFINKFFKDNEKELKQKINKSLSSIEAIETNLSRKQGNKKRYPLGTVAIVKQVDKTFFLLALTKFNANHRAEITKSEYQRVIMQLFDFTEQHSQGFKINIPLIGNGHSGTELSEQKLLEFILFSITLHDKLTLSNGVDIILHKDVKDKIDLNKINYYYNTEE